MGSVKKISSRTQGGSSGVYVLSMISLLLCTLWIAFKLIPIYLDDHAVGSILESLDNYPDVREASPREVEGRIQKGFLINSIRDIPEENIKVNRNNSFLTVDVNYERRVDLVFNIDLVMTFENSWKIRQ